MNKFYARAAHGRLRLVVAPLAVAPSLGLLSGCGFSSKTVTPMAGVALKMGTRLSVMPVTNHAGGSFNIDIQTMLKDA